jgi:hypothetical protein
MNRQRLLFMTFALLIGSAIAGESPQPIPDSLTALGGNEPFWVSARSVTKNGKLDLTALPTDARIVIESATQQTRRAAVNGGPAETPQANASQICPVIATSRHISEKGAGSWRALLGKMRMPFIVRPSSGARPAFTTASPRRS